MSGFLALARPGHLALEPYKHAVWQPGLEPYKHAVWQPELERLHAQGNVP